MQRNRQWFLRHLIFILLPIVLMAGGTVALFLFVRSQETREVRLRFEWQAAVLLKGLQDVFEAQQHVITSLQALYASTDVDRKIFQQFAKTLLAQRPDIQCLEWIPRVPEVQRMQYEAGVAGEGFSGFQIREYNADKKLVRAASRSEYYPVDYIEPFTGNERAQGFDLASDPVRREALMRAGETDSVIATGRITLVQEQGKQYGFLVFAPVYYKNAVHATAEQRRAGLAGFVLGVFRSGDLIENFLKNARIQGAMIQLYNDPSLAPENMLYGSAATEHPGKPFEKVMTFPFAGRTWACRFLLPDAVIASRQTGYANVILAGGIFITVLMITLLNVILGRSKTVQNLVAQRTAELQEAMALLLSTQARQKAILENIPYLAWLKDRDGRFLEVNELFARSCGHTAADIIGKTDLDIWHRELAEKYRADDREVMRTGKPEFVEEPIADTAGTQWFETFKTPVFDNAGAVIGTTGLARNITERKRLEQELNMQRKRLENVVTGTNAGTWDWNVQTGEVVFNKRWAGIAGYDLAELSPVSIQTWTNLAHPDDLQRSNDLLERHFAGELEYYSCECRMRHKNGSWVWVHDRGKVFEWTEDGKPLRMTGMHLDITASKKTEAEIRLQRVLLACLIDSVPDIVFFKDMNGTYLGCNPAFAEFVGKARTDIIGKTDYDLFDRDTADFFRMHDRKMIELKAPRHNEEWITYPDGRRTLIDTLKTPYWGPDGELLGVLGISRNITEQKRIEETLTRQMKELSRINDELYRANEQTGLILNDIGDGVAVVDMHGRIVIINTVARNLLGITESVVEVISVEKLFARCKLTEQQQQIIHALIPPQSFATTVALEPPVELDIKCTMLHDAQHNSIGQIYVFHDFTRIREIDRMKSNFVSSVSHELRTPLTSIKGFVATILQDPEMPEHTRLDFLTIINGETDRLTRLIEDILEVSRIETGRLEMRCALYALDEVVQKIYPTMKKLADDKVLEFTCAIQEGLPELTGDVDKMCSVFINLLSNAVKFTPSGGRILLSAQSNDKYCIVRFEDTGMGIPEKDLPHIYERFYRVERPGTEIPGTGLGLAICRELVHLHGGHIEVQSALQKGTTFSVYLPVSGERPEDSAQGGEKQRKR